MFTSNTRIVAIDLKRKTQCESILKLILRTSPFITADEVMDLEKITQLKLTEVYKKHTSYGLNNMEYTKTITLLYCKDTYEIYASVILYCKHKEKMGISISHLIYCGNEVFRFE